MDVGSDGKCSHSKNEEAKPQPQPQRENLHQFELDEGGFYHARQLTELLPRLRLDPSLASFFDVVLIVRGDRFEAHRVVLASASPVFAVMFTNGMRESRMREIVLHDVDVRSWSLAQDFIYTGRLPEIGMGVALKLLKVAAMYQMDAFLPVVIVAVQGLLFASNCCQVLCVAEELGLSSLKSQVMSIVKYHFHWISSMKQFRTIGIGSMRKVLMSRDLMVRSEVQVFEGVLNWVFGMQTSRNGSTTDSESDKTTSMSDEESWDFEMDVSESESEEEPEILSDRSCYVNELLDLVDLSNMTDMDLKYVARIPGMRTNLHSFFDKVIHRLLHSRQDFEPEVDYLYRIVCPRYSESKTYRFAFKGLKRGSFVERETEDLRLGCLFETDNDLTLSLKTSFPEMRLDGLRLCIVVNGQVKWIGERCTTIPVFPFVIPEAENYIDNDELHVFLQIIGTSSNT